MKKLITLILAAAMLLPCVACKKDDGGANGDLPTLKWMVPSDPESGWADIEEALNVQLAEKLGCQIDMEIIDSSAYAEKLKLGFSSGLDFDLCYVDNSGFIDAVTKGGLFNMNDFLKDSNITDSVPADVIEYGRYDDGIYAIPNNQILVYQPTVQIRQDLADEFGLDVSKIDSLEDVEPFLAWVKENKPEYYPVRVTCNLLGIQDDYKDTFYDEFVTNAVFAVQNPDGTATVKKATDVPGFWELAELKNDWYKKGYVRSDIATVYGDDWDDVNNGKYAVNTSTYKPGGIESNNQRFPDHPCYEATISVPYRNYFAAGGTMTAINKNSKNPELAFKLIELVNSDPEIYNLYAYGVEGKHYTRDEEGKVTINIDGGYKLNHGWKYGNQFNAYVLAGQPDDVWEKTKEVNESAVCSNLTGFKPDLSEIKLEISQITTVTGKYSSVGRGYDEVANYKEAYLKELDAAGIDKVVEVLQKQVDEFLKK